ncbi:MAG: hypothetical protein HYY17_07070 [Planctomycetes bacterium]|nr:hypothetical protein [Planctomycetota bacterium]
MSCIFLLAASCVHPAPPPTEKEARRPTLALVRIPSPAHGRFPAHPWFAIENRGAMSVRCLGLNGIPWHEVRHRETGRWVPCWGATAIELVDLPSGSRIEFALFGGGSPRIDATQFDLVRITIHGVGCGDHEIALTCEIR